MNDVKYEYNPMVDELYLLKHKGVKHVVIADYNYGHIICFNPDGAYIHDWVSGYFEENKNFKKIGTLIRPRWDKYKKVWVKRGDQEKLEDRF